MFEAREETPERRGRVAFDDLHLQQRHMPDPQQPEFSPEGAPLVMPGARRDRVLVEPMVFERIRRGPSPQELAAAAVVAEPPAPDPEELARELIAEARATARAMLSQARDVIAAERAQAVATGHAEGYAAGKAEADEETAGLVQTCERIGIHVMEERERVLAENETDVVELAMAIAERIVGAAISVDEELVVESCRGAMRKAFQRGSMQVLAHPEDLERLRDAGPRLAEELGGVEHLDFVAERRLERGSVVVRTPAGEIDATIRGKAEKIEQTLREGIEQRRAERRAA